MIERGFVFKTFKLLILLIYLSDFCSCIKTNNDQNYDILSMLMEMPDQLEFVECKPGSGQIVLEAKYRVTGMNACFIEDLLHDNYGMGRLEYACCGWETHENGKLEITNEFNNNFRTCCNYNFISILMYSEETLIQDRDKWDKIPYFYVIVEVLNI